MGGGAWPFLVGGAICLVNSVNERDLSLLNNCVNDFIGGSFLEGHWVQNSRKIEAITGMLPYDASEAKHNFFIFLKHRKLTHSIPHSILFHH